MPRPVVSVKAACNFLLSFKTGSYRITANYNTLRIGQTAYRFVRLYIDNFQIPQEFIATGNPEAGVFTNTRSAANRNRDIIAVYFGNLASDWHAGQLGSDHGNLFVIVKLT